LISKNAHLIPLFCIRWLRDDEPTDEKLDMVFYMLKIARYDQLQ